MTPKLIPYLLCWQLFVVHGLAQYGPMLPSLEANFSPDHNPMSRVGPSDAAIEAPTTPAAVTTAAVRGGRIDKGDLADPNKEADAVLKLLRRSKEEQGGQPFDVKMGCFTESPFSPDDHGDGSEKASAGNTGSSMSKPGLQSLLMQVVGQVANYNDKIAQETDNRKAIVKMLESYIRNQQESLKRSESILNEYRTSIPKYSE